METGKIKEKRMPTIEELEERVSDLRQEASAERVKIRDLKQKVNEQKDRSRILQQEVSRLQNDLRERDKELSIYRSEQSKYTEMETALANVVRHRYGEISPFDCTCGRNWCTNCVTKAWTAANKLVGRKL